MLKTQKENLAQRMNFGHASKRSVLSKTAYSDRYAAAKSNISEDIATLKVSSFQSETNN